MAKLAALVKWVILLPILLAALLLAVANDQTVPVHLNPFQVEDPVLRADLPLYQFAFILFVLGALAGGLVTWRGQRKYRSRSRRRGEQAEFWRERAERSARPEPAAPVPSSATAFLPRPERG